MLSAGVHKVPQGHVAAVVTHLEMCAPPDLTDIAPPDGVRIRHIPAPDEVWYRDLIRRVGENWLWVSRLELARDTLVAILSDPKVMVIVAEKNGVAEGILELDFRTEGECELSFFGLSAVLIGSGSGRALMNHAIKTTFAQPVSRFHLHTCTLDHPEALAFYRRSGFHPTRHEIEIMPDPRLSGLFPKDAAPRWPIMAPD